MKFETLNGILTFVLGVLVVLGVVFALRVVDISRDARHLQKLALQDNAVMVQTQQLFADAAAYNQKYQSPDLTRILQSMAARPAPAGH